MKINVVSDDDDDDDDQKKVNDDGDSINDIDRNFSNGDNGKSHSNEDRKLDEETDKKNLIYKNGNNQILTTLQKSKVEFRFF